MKNILFVVLALGLFVGCASGGKNTAGYDRTGLPITLSAEDKAYLKFSQYRKVTPSRSGKYLAVQATFDNQSYISIIDRVNKKIMGSAQVGENFQASQFFWIGDEKLIVNGAYVDGYLKKNGERSKRLIFSMLNDGSKVKQIFPKRTSVGTTTVFSGSISSMFIVHDELIQDKFLLVAESKYSGRDASSRLSLLNVNNGASKVYDIIKMEAGSYAVDNNLNARLAFRISPKDYSITALSKNLKTDTWKKVKFFNKKTRALDVLGFAKNNKTFYFLADNARTLNTLFSADVSEAGKVSNVKEVFSYGKGDVLGAAWDKMAKIPLYVEYGFGRPRRKYFSTSEHAMLLKELDKSFPVERVYLSDRKSDINLVIVRSDRRPTTYYIFNRKTKEVRELSSSNEEVRKLTRLRSRPISFKARDGVPIRGYFYQPQNFNSKTPLVVHPHGGPFGVRDAWGYNGDIQFLLSRGYSVMQVNFRGSSGQGRKFLELGYKNQSKTMQYDLVDAVEHVISKGWATKGKACLWGVSYGGYASIMSTMLFPEYFACGVGFGGVYDYNVRFKEGDIERMKYLDEYLKKTHPPRGGPMRMNSPIGHVKKLKRPVFLAHGEDDVRVTVTQARLLKEELEKNGKTFKYQEFPGVGHWFVSDQYQKNQFYTQLIDFLDENLKGKKK